MSIVVPILLLFLLLFNVSYEYKVTTFINKNDDSRREKIKNDYSKEVTNSLKIGLNLKNIFKGVFIMIFLFRTLSMVGAVILGCGTTDKVTDNKKCEALIIDGITVGVRFPTHPFLRDIHN